MKRAMGAAAAVLSVLIAFAIHARRIDAESRLRDEYRIAEQANGWSLVLANRSWDVDVSPDGRLLATITMTAFDDALQISSIGSNGVGVGRAIGGYQGTIDRCARFDPRRTPTGALAVLHYAPVGPLVRSWVSSSGGAAFVKLSTPPDVSCCFDVAPDGGAIAYRGADRRVHLDSRIDDDRFGKKASLADASDLLFTPDGSALLRRVDQRVVAYTLATGAEREIARGIDRLIAVSPDGRWLAGASRAGEVRIYEVATGASFPTSGASLPPSTASRGARREGRWVAHLRGPLEPDAITFRAAER